MFNKITLLIATSLVLLAVSADALEFIELNDANKNVMHIDDSKALEVVQAGLKNDLKFKSFKDARNFIFQCQHLSNSMDNLSDDDYNGLAAKMKALLREEPLSSLCHIKLTKLDEYSLLGDRENGNFYLSQKRLNALIAIGESLEKHPKIKQVLGHLYETRTRNAGRTMLAHASEDTALFFGELDNSGWFFDTKYFNGCEISSIKPICKLVRGQADDKVTANGLDLVEFNELVNSTDEKDRNKLARRIEDSGLDMDVLKSSCQSIDGDLRPIHLVRKYLDNKFLDESEIQDQKAKDSNFNFYWELERLCETQKGL